MKRFRFAAFKHEDPLSVQGVRWFDLDDDEQRHAATSLVLAGKLHASVEIEARNKTIALSELLNNQSLLDGARRQLGLAPVVSAVPSEFIKGVFEKHAPTLERTLRRELTKALRR